MRPPGNHQARRVDREVRKLELRQAKQRAQADQARIAPAREEPRPKPVS